MAHYVASKGGVIGLTKALAVELGAARHHGEHDPARIDRDADDARVPRQRGNLPSIEVIAKMIPVRRTGTPDDIAAACAFLCSEEAGLHHRTADQPQRRPVPVSERPPARTAADGRVGRRRRRGAARGASGTRPPTVSSPTGPDAPRIPNVLTTLMRHPTLAGPFLVYNAVLL